jgi:hypothetical protein
MREPMNMPSTNGKFGASVSGKKMLHTIDPKKVGEGTKVGKKYCATRHKIFFSYAGTSPQYREPFSVTGPVTDRTLLTGEIRGCSQEESKQAHRKEGSSKASQEGS